MTIHIEHIVKVLYSLKHSRKFNISNVNNWFSGYIATVPGFAGSWLTFLFFGAGIWAVINGVFRRYPLTLPVRSVPFVASGFLLCTSMLVSGLMAENKSSLVSAIAPLSAFLVVPFLISRYVSGDPHRSWAMFCRYAPVGAMAGVAAGLWTESPAGGAGNANVFAAAMAVLAVFSLAGTFARSGRNISWGVAGYLAATWGILMSGSRTLYPFILLLPLLAVTLTRGFKVRFFLAGCALLTIVILANYDTVLSQLKNFSREIQLLEADRPQSSLGVRVELWKASVLAIRSGSAIGYGPQNKMEAVKSHIDDRLEWITHTHVHNAFLDVTVAAGVGGFVTFALVLFSPLAMTRGQNRSSPGRNFALISIVILFTTIGTTGVFLVHDLLLVLYILPIILVSATDSGPRITCNRLRTWTLTYI